MMVMKSSQTSMKRTIPPMELIEMRATDATDVGLCIMQGNNHGLEIVGGQYQAAGNDVCPLGAVLIGVPTKRALVTLQGVFDDAAAELNVTPAWVHEFLSGWDDDEDPSGLNPQAWQFGEDLRLDLEQRSQTRIPASSR